VKIFCASCGKGNDEIATYCADCGAKLEQIKIKSSSSRLKVPLLLLAISFLLIASPGIWVAFNYAHWSISIDEFFWGLQGMGFILAGVSVILGSRIIFEGKVAAPAVVITIGLLMEGFENLIFYTNTSSALSTSGWQKFNYLLMGIGYLLISTGLFIAINSKKNND
jgi:hypothetical protein